MIGLFKKLLKAKQLNLSSGELVKIFKARIKKKPKLICLIRLRNEEDIILDTLDYLKSIVDGVIIYDDASEDHTLDIVEQHPLVLAIIKNLKWQKGGREKFETIHRSTLLNFARSLVNPMWFLYLDADERLIGDVRNTIINADCDAIRMELYDAYATPDDNRDFKFGDEMANFRKYFGVERRDILVAWRNNSQVKFKGLDAREPTIPERALVKTLLSCQHYGKALSQVRWEQKCEYYIQNFDYETYGKKWMSRRGQFVHTKSDFDTDLELWGDNLFKKAKKIH